MLVEHRAYFRTVVPQLLPYRIGAITEAAGRHITPRQITGAIRGYRFSFSRKSICRPIGLARRVTEDLRKRQTDEPPRGPGAHVSLIVVAINDYRLLSTKLSGTHASEVFAEDVDGSRTALLLAFRLAKYLDQLGSR